MKNLYTFLLSIIVFQTAFAQEPQKKFVLSELIPGNETKNYVASEYIDMINGFEYSPESGKNVTAKIDPYLIFPPNTGIYGGPNPEDDGVVGTLPGKLNISATGAATYNIPLDLPL